MAKLVDLNKIIRKIVGLEKDVAQKSETILLNDESELPDVSEQKKGVLYLIPEEE